MSSLTAIQDLTTLSDVELGTLVVRLEREERDLSKRRNRLHDRIDFVQAGGFVSAELAADQLAALRAGEYELSERRRALHRRIDEVHAERNRRPTSA